MADNTNELSGGVTEESTCVRIFKEFVTKMANKLYFSFVCEPEGDDHFNLRQNVCDIHIYSDDTCHKYTHHK